MHIRQSIYIEATPSVAMDAARGWMHDELQPLDTLPHLALGQITEGTTAEGTQSLTTVIDQDGIQITATVSGAQHQAGTRLTMDLRTLGNSFASRLRNLTLLPGRKLLHNQVKTSLIQIKERATSDPLAKDHW